MRIAFFTDSYLPIRDGVSSVVSGLAHALGRQGHEVRIYTPRPYGSAVPETIVEDGVPVVRSRSVPVPYYPGYRFSIFPFVQVERSGVAEWADVIHLHTPGMMGAVAFLSGRGHRKPIVGTFHTNIWASRESFPGGPLIDLFYRVTWWWTRGLYWRLDRTTVPTATARDELVRASKKPYARPIEVIPNGIELEHFHPGANRPDWRERCGLSAAPLVTYLGRLTADKGALRFLDAVEELVRTRDLAVAIAGSGPAEPEVVARLKSNPALARCARYLGSVAEEEKAALLAQSDVFVLPSVSDTSSIAVLEAMACGTPVVVSDVGGVSDLVADGVTGRLAHLAEPGALSTTIDEMLSDSAGLERMGRAAAEYVVRSASIDSTARRFIALYASLLNSGPVRAARVA